MSRFTERPRGVKVHVLDLSSIESEALAWRVEQNPDCYQARIHGGEWAIAVKDDRVFALCTEGVGYEVTEEEPLELEFHGSYHKRDDEGNIQSNVTVFDFAPFGSYEIIPEDLVDYPVLREEDLADFIRVFGSRLESNFWTWFDELK